MCVKRSKLISIAQHKPFRTHCRKKSDNHQANCPFTGRVHIKCVHIFNVGRQMQIKLSNFGSIIARIVHHLHNTDAYGPKTNTKLVLCKKKRVTDIKLRFNEQWQNNRKRRVKLIEAIQCKLVKMSSKVTY